MDALHIKRLEARYHLGRSTVSARERLDSLLREMLDHAVELALERIGISPHDELCLRRLYAPVRLRLGATDQALVAQWSHSFAEYVREVLDKNDGSSVVRYRSRLHGLIDFANGVALRRYRRVWAWAQLGFTHAAEGASDSHYAADLVCSLLNEPQYIVPVLKSLAETRQLMALAAQLDGAQWREWGKAALTVAGVDPGAIDNTMRLPGAQTDHVQRLVEMSSLASTVMQYPSVFSKEPVALRSLSALIVLESEPGLSRVDMDYFVTLINGVENLLCAGHDASTTAVAGDDTSREKTPLDQSNEQVNTDSNRAPHIGTPSINQFNSSDIQEGGVPDITDTGPRAPQNKASLSTPPEQAQAADDHYALPEVRAHGSTAFGGLLFLIKIVEALGIPDEIVRHPVLSQRPIRWVLHQLALVLIEADPTDPAALAFCGLDPETALPWENETQASELEQTLFLRWRTAIAEQLRSRLDRNGISDARLLAEVCRRRARIVTDPGWFEIVYSLNDVSTEYRRAALDSDPGYVPWLGIVMAFTYE